MLEISIKQTLSSRSRFNFELNMQAVNDNDCVSIEFSWIWIVAYFPHVREVNDIVCL